MTKIEDPIAWCHRHDAMVLFHLHGGVTLMVKGYTPQASYSLEAAINACIRKMEEAQPTLPPTVPEQDKYYKVTWWTEDDITHTIFLPLISVKRHGDVEKALRATLVIPSGVLRLIYPKTLFDSNGNEVL